MKNLSCKVGGLEEPWINTSQTQVVIWTARIQARLLMEQLERLERTQVAWQWIDIQDGVCSVWVVTCSVFSLLNQCDQRLRETEQYHVHTQSPTQFAGFHLFVAEQEATTHKLAFLIFFEEEI